MYWYVTDGWAHDHQFMLMCNQNVFSNNRYLKRRLTMYSTYYNDTEFSWLFPMIDIFSESPQSTNAVHEESVIFTCIIAIAPDDMYFTVNGTLASQSSVTAKGFKESAIVNSNSRNLTTTASILYNNTNITCLQVNYSPISVMQSDIAVLLVQGIMYYIQYQ